MKNTRERILEKSLLLFSQNGYSGTSIRDISRDVGIRESSIYKHFESKQSILDQLIQKMQDRIREAFYNNADNSQETADERYECLTYEQTCEITWRMFQLFTKDTYVSAYRRLLMREQFNNQKLTEIYNQYFLSGVLENEERVFAGLMQKQIFRQTNPKLLALQFYGVIFSLFQVYDCHPEKEEEIKQLLFAHIEEMRKRNILHKKESQR